MQQRLLSAGSKARVSHLMTLSDKQGSDEREIGGVCFYYKCHQVPCGGSAQVAHQTHQSFRKSQWSLWGAHCSALEMNGGRSCVVQRLLQMSVR